jgi:hypothetical protein
MNARQDRAHNRAEPGKQPLGFASKIMGALIKGVCKRRFILELGAGADANARSVAPTFFVGTNLSVRDRPGRPGSRRERPLHWAS